jgi:hypothetical protein
MLRSSESMPCAGAPRSRAFIPFVTLFKVMQFHMHCTKQCRDGNPLASVHVPFHPFQLRLIGARGRASRLHEEHRGANFGMFQAIELNAINQL